MKTLAKLTYMMTNSIKSRGLRSIMLRPGQPSFQLRINGKVLGSLMPKNFQNIYYLKSNEARCNKESLDNFYIANPKAHVLMKPWYQEEEYFKDKVGISKYTTIPFIPLVQYLMAMLSPFHREADCMFFKSEWIPLAHGVMSMGTMFNWANILSANILWSFEKVVQRLDARESPFYFLVFS